MSKQIRSFGFLALTAALIGSAFAGNAAATDLRIYSGFGEVRQPAAVTNGQVNLNLPVSLYNTILPDSLDLDGANVTSRSLAQQANWLSSLEGKQVTLHEDGKTERVTLVRARDLLIKDAQGLYRTVSAQNLSYDALPPVNPLSPSWQATFNVVGVNVMAPTLTYLTRALSWAPRYTLKLSGTTAALSALADIRNTSEQAFSVNATELFAGEVQLQGGQAYPQLADATSNVVASRLALPPAPKVNSLGELRGLYRYGLDQPFTLPANGNVSLPFLNPKVTFERFGVASLGFSQGGGKGNLNRGYRLKSDTELPAGPVTVREDGRLVGQVGVDTTSAGTSLDLNLGADPDLTYTRSAAVTVQGKGTKTETRTIRVTYLLENAKDRATRFELTEYGLDSRATVTGQATRTPEGNLLIKVDVPAKSGTTNGKATVTFIVVTPSN
ncbi:hypothetical protein Q0M94_15465 [Deinococcus radiomollis]|uniref:hypothetical protein n=1 Tax=Deinococcus radiomollis TaxID=468916 RepID=UPI003891241C